MFDICMETSYVLSGLSRKCDTKLISPHTISIRQRSTANALQQQDASRAGNLHKRSMDKGMTCNSTCSTTVSRESEYENETFPLRRISDAIGSQQFERFSCGEERSSLSSLKYDNVNALKRKSTDLVGDEPDRNSLQTD